MTKPSTVLVRFNLFYAKASQFSLMLFKFFEEKLVNFGKVQTLYMDLCLVSVVTNFQEI